MHNAGNRPTEDVAIRLLLVSPSPPPNGGIATWTATLLEILENQSQMVVQLVNSAYPKRMGGSDESLVLKSIFSLYLVLRASIRIFNFRPDVVHICSSAGRASIRDRMII